MNEFFRKEMPVAALRSQTLLGVIKFLLASVLVLCWSTQTRGGNISLVQHASKDAGTTTSASLAFNSNNTSGNWIGVCISAGVSGETFTVTDSKGNTYRNAIQFNATGSGNTLGIFYAENIGAGANTVTVSDSTSSTLRFAIFEYSGIVEWGSLDKSTAAQGNSTAPNSGTATTTANSELQFAAILTGGAASFTPGSGYTTEETVPAAPNTTLIVEDQLQTSTGTVSAGATLGATTQWAAGLATFKAAPTISSLNPTSGVTGTSVTVNGTNFDSTVSQGNGILTFSTASGDIKVTATSWSPTSIVAPVPTVATTGNVMVAVQGANSNGVSFTVANGSAHLVQSKSKDAGTTTSSSLAFATNNTAGNFIAVCIRAGTSGQVFTVTDSQGNSYQQASQLAVTVGSTNGNALAIYYASNIAGGANTVTVSDTTSDTLRFAILEYSGVARSNALDVTVSSQGTSSSPSSGNATTTQGGDLLIGAVAALGSGTYTAGSGYALDQSIGTYPNTTLVAEDQVQANAGTASAGATLSSSQSWGAMLAAFKAGPNVSGVSSSFGVVGASLTITGTNFGSSQGSSTVAFNGVNGTPTTWTATSIVVPVPVGATTGNVVVTVGGVPSNGVAFAVWPNITGLSVTGDAVGASVTIVGTTFGATQGTSTVTFNGTPATATSWNASTITATVPSGATTGNVVVTVGGASSAGVTFTVLSTPSISNLSTSSGPVGSAVNISGANFGSVQGSGFVSFNGTVATVTSWNATNIAVTVPTGATTGNVVVNASGVSTNGTAFTVLTTPGITTLSTTSASVGTSVTITGTNFGSTQGTSTVTFNGTGGTPTSWSTTSIAVPVPTGATSGPIVVIVSGVQSNCNSECQFTVTANGPVITSVTPPAAPAGGSVTITGSGFGASQGGLQFNGAGVSITSWSDTSITANVPNVTGPITVIANGVTSNAAPFALLEPLSVSSISPNLGPVGTTVTVVGAGFGPTQSTSAITFYGTAATVTSWSDTQIVATVPSGTGSGPVYVQIAGLTGQGPSFTINATTQLTDSLQHTSNYTSANIGGRWVFTDSQGSGCSTCTYRGVIHETFDTYGDVLSRTDENGNISRYTYDGNNNVQTVTVPISSVQTATTTYTYNGFGEVLTATDPMGFVTTNTYDGNGNLLTITTPAPSSGVSASVTQFAYNTLGELIKITDPLQNSTSLTYTPTGLVQTITDAQSNVTTYAYDSRGNRTSVTDANNKQTSFSYDSMNRLTQITYPDSTTTQFGYDYRGRRISVTDQNQKTTTYAYDDADRLITVTDAANNVTTYGYDTENNLTSIQDANHNTTYFAYDAFGRVYQTTFPSGAVETYGYDNVGNLINKTDRKNQLITYTYDQLNRLVQKSYPDTSTVNYTYDDDSRLTQVTDPTGTYQFTFDNMGRLTGTSTQYAFLTSRTFTTSYTYDAASNRVGFTDPETGSTAYAYDTLNRLQTLTPPTAISGGSFGFAYDALSRRISLTRPNGVNTSYSYDNRSHLLSVTHAKGGATLDGANYTLDNAGNRTVKSDLYAGVTTNYGYDAIYELLNATQAGATTESYTYDPVGNRLSNLTGSGWNYNTSNELNSRPAVSSTYDANGNTTSKTDSTGTTTYAWDYENRLSSVTLSASGGTVQFKYDPFRRRIEKISPTTTSIFAYDGGNLVETVNAGGGLVARYAQDLEVDAPLAMLRSTTTDYYEADGLNSITSLTDSTGALAQTYTYDSFGNTVATTGTLGNYFQYTGREFDTEANLYFYRARYYDPQAGRFLSEDPITFSGGIDFYAYVQNNPVEFTDAFGLQAARPLPLPSPTPPAPSPGPVLVPNPEPAPTSPSLPWVWLIFSLLNPQPTNSTSGFGPGNYHNTLLNYHSNQAMSSCKDNGCQPCDPPVGTISNRVDTYGTHTHQGVPVPHWKLYVMQQSPPSKGCKCQWVPIPDNQGGFGGGTPPSGTVPIGPAGGGGLP